MHVQFIMWINMSEHRKVQNNPSLSEAQDHFISFCNALSKGKNMAKRDEQIAYSYTNPKEKLVEKSKV